MFRVCRSPVQTPTTTARLCSPMNTIINDGRFVQADSYTEISYSSRNEQVPRGLEERINRRAFHVPEHESNPSGTYTEALVEEILDWFRRQREHDRGHRVMWLYENAVTRAIINAVLTKLPKDALAGAYIFQRKHITGINQEMSLVPNVAYELLQCFPGLARHINPVIYQDPAIFDRSFAIQFEQLVVKPLESYVEAEAEIGHQLRAPNTKVFIVDDLDGHLSFDNLQRIVQTIDNMLQEHTLPLVFLLVSRRPRVTRVSWGSEIASLLRV